MTAMDVLKHDFPRVMTLDRAGQLFRAQNGDRAAYLDVTVADLDGLLSAETFVEFLSRNGQRILIVNDEGVVEGGR